MILYWTKVPSRKRGSILWKEAGPTPLGWMGYSPQGMTWANGKLLLANTWKNRRSCVYEIDPSPMGVLRSFFMPREAVHTSGLAWDGKRLWATDYRSHLVYALALEPSLQEGEANLLGSFPSGLEGTSACCVVPWEGGPVLALSDFMHSEKTRFVRMGPPHEVVFEYRNEGFSQGLAFADGYLYEAENKFGIDVVNKIGIELLKRFKSSSQATVEQYPAPGIAVEDLAWDGKNLWTSDEVSFKIFRGTFQ